MVENLDNVFESGSDLVDLLAPNRNFLANFMNIKEFLILNPMLKYPMKNISFGFENLGDTYCASSDLSHFPGRM